MRSQTNKLEFFGVTSLGNHEPEGREFESPRPLTIRTHVFELAALPVRASATPVLLNE